MQLNNLAKFLLLLYALLAIETRSGAQSRDGWYKVYTGKMGDYTATLHLHKSARMYSGYLWFMQHQWPMQVYYNEASKKSDSLFLSAGNGPMNIVLSGILTGTNFTGNSELSKDNGVPKKAPFELQVNAGNQFTPFQYYYTEGYSTLPPQLKNPSGCNYKASAIWPANNNTTDQVFKNNIRQMLSVNTPQEEIGKWLIDEKNRYISSWKNDNIKRPKKEIAELGLSLSVEEELRMLVMYENHQYITLARYNSGYSGGAHGNFATAISTIDKQSAKRLKLSDVVKPAGISLLTRILNQVARVQFGIKNTKPLNQNGFLVNTIKPNENFYLTEQGIGFIYPPYAIRPFADGEVNLLVPFTVLKTYLQPAIVKK